MCFSKTCKCDSNTKAAFESLALHLTTPGAPVFDIMTPTVDFTMSNSSGQHLIAFNDGKNPVIALVVMSPRYGTVYCSRIAFASETITDELLASHGFPRSVLV